MTGLLPQIETESQYSELFKNNALWEPAIRAIADKHALSGHLSRGILGSNIVYRAGESWIKVFPPFAGDELEIEKAGLESVNVRFQFDVPRLQFEGNIDGWTYMVMSHVKGERIGDIWKNASNQQKVLLAQQIAEVTRSLQSISPNQKIQTRVVWNQFIADRFFGAISTQEKRGLQSNELSKLRDFISGFSTSDFQIDKTVYLHSDLTADHFLVDPETFRITGVIDFADSMNGNSEYDLAAYFSYLFKDQREAIQAFFKVWKSQVAPERIFMWVVLHRFSNLLRYFGEDRLKIAKSFSELANEAFGYE